MNIIEKIRASAPDITEQEIDGWIVPDLLVHYSDRINQLANRVYGGIDIGWSVACGAFRQYAEEALRKGVHTYLFKSQRWRSDGNLDTYLLTCLNRLAKRLKEDIGSVKKICVPVCPACKTVGRKEFLHAEGDKFRCEYCTSESFRLEDEDGCESELVFHDTFSVHSRKGVRCPKCHRFIPISYTEGQYRICCPYLNCNWYGPAIDAPIMSHPMGMSSDYRMVSINIKSSDSNTSWQDNFSDNSINADIKMEVAEQYQKEYDTVREVIETQMSRIMREPRDKAIKKQLMYQAFYNMLERQPEDMVAYLARLRHSCELPIQSQIFQDFIRLIENALPFDIVKHGVKIEVLSLQDPYLDLFLGISNFSELVGSNLIVPNKTSEIYIGGRQMRNFGRCFIGLLCDVESDDGISLMSNVDHYTFSHIKMKDIEPGTQVHVTHLRIPSHYEMNGLVPLQRIRRRIVDSVYQRLHGKRRVVGNESQELC